MSVLICDDELMNRKVASKILKKEGFEVLEARNAQEAYALLESEEVKLILMDLMMPVIDGFEAIVYIKSQKKLAGIPIIIISALSSKDAILKGLSLNVKAHLSKPFDIADFVSKVQKYYQRGAYDV